MKKQRGGKIEQKKGRHKEGEKKEKEEIKTPNVNCNNNHIDANSGLDISHT